MSSKFNTPIYQKMNKKEFAIDPKFSVYELVNRVNKQSMLRHRRTMSLVSFQIENTTIKYGSKARIFAGFQKFSRFLPQVARYNQLAANAEMIYVFGIPDIEPPAIPGVTYVPLKPTDQLAKEWFLVSYAPDYYSALATEEMTDIDDPDHLRVFEGVWTFDLTMVSILNDWLTSTVDEMPPRWSEDNRNYKRQVELMSKTIEQLTRRLPAVNTDSPTSNITNAQVKTAIKQEVMPSLGSLIGSSGHSMEQEAVILFCDIRKFTSIAEKYRPAELVSKVLNPYIHTVTTAINKHGGEVDKFLGDGVLAIFSNDNGQTNDADRAVAAASDIIEELNWRKNNLKYIEPIDVGIGIAAGEVAIGAVGGSALVETTVIGDVVNIAQRLSELGENEVWLSEGSYNRLTSNYQIEEGRPVKLRGKDEDIPVYRHASLVSNNAK